MINFLGGLLAPIFTPMGVSEADLISYLTTLQGYVWYMDREKSKKNSSYSIKTRLEWILEA